jgi:hypothetical protein
VVTNPDASIIEPGGSRRILNPNTVGERHRTDQGKIESKIYRLAAPILYPRVYQREAPVIVDVDVPAAEDIDILFFDRADR